PGMIGAYLGALLHSASDRAEVSAIEVNAALVGDPSLLIRSIAISAAVLGDLHHQVVIFGQAQQQFFEGFWPDLPAVFGDRAFDGSNRARVEFIVGGGIVGDDVAVVVVHAQKIE